MDERVYRRVLANGGWRANRLLADCGVNGILREAARGLRQRERTEQAIEIAAPAELRNLSRVESVVDGVVTLVAVDSVAQQKLLRRADAMLSALQRTVSGLRKLVVLPPSRGSELSDNE
ncbi:MAG: DciA family protein [Phycisphaerae bacterium]